MSSHNVKKLEYGLNPGITLRVSQSNVVVRFNFEEHYFKEYIKAKTNNLPENYLENETVNATAHGLPMPRWLLRLLISHLTDRVDSAVEDERPTS
jgi:hypothetical protein